MNDGSDFAGSTQYRTANAIKRTPTITAGTISSRRFVTRRSLEAEVDRARAQPKRRFRRSISAESDLSDPPIKDERGRRIVSILWIILIVIVVLALLGFFSRGRWSVRDARPPRTSDPCRTSALTTIL